MARGFTLVSCFITDFAKPYICIKRVLSVLVAFICVIGLLGCNDGNRLATAIVVSVLGVVQLNSARRNSHGLPIQDIQQHPQAGRLLGAHDGGRDERRLSCGDGSWGLDLANVPAEGEILDIGCGGGANLSRLMDRSLPFKDDTFAMATAFETVYFWPDIEKSFAEVRRIIVPGGKFLIVNEDDGLSGNNEKWEKMIEGMHTDAPDELKADLSAAGFRDIVVHLKDSKHWLFATAIK